jgi:hydrogenase maturation protease
MTRARVLVAGVGNMLLGDDGFGVEVVRRLLREPALLPDGVRVADYGIRALHLAYDLLEGYDALVIVDAMSQGHAPGTLFVFEPDVAAPPSGGATATDPHGLYPGAVLRVASDLGARVGLVRVVGCEPADVDEGIGLSPPVENAVTEALRLVRELALAAVGGSEAAAAAPHKEERNVEEEAP